jgi:hypothetical protein
MRRSHFQRSFIEENNQFYGVSLGWDFTSEHEWGIKQMKSKFGITNKKTNFLGIEKDVLGIEARQITRGEVFFAENDELCVLTSSKGYSTLDEFTPKDILAHDINYIVNDLECAWDESDFCIATKNKDNFPKLRELYEAFKNKNIVISFLKSELNPFSNSSLSILIKDKLPKEVIDEMYLVDKESLDLIEYEKKIGVTKLKEDAKKSGYKGEKYFMACSPSWIDYKNSERREERKKELDTKYDITFWINYSDDDDNCGWYTAEQIIKWLSTPGLKLTSLNK